MTHFPHMLRIRQTFDGTALDDIPGEIAGQLAGGRIGLHFYQFLFGGIPGKSFYLFKLVAGFHFHFKIE